MAISPVPHRRRTAIRRSVKRLGRVVSTYAAICGMIFSNVPARAATLYWDTDGSVVGNDEADGTGLGGTGNWDVATANWWDNSNLVTWPNTLNNVAVFSGPNTVLPSANLVTLSSGIVANRLEFRRGGYQLTGGDFTLAGTDPSLYAGLGLSAVIDSQILGTSGLTMTGGGAIRLGNLTNAYTGTTTISYGSLIITDQSALGTDSSPIVVKVFNPNPINTSNIKGFGGGSLMLDGRGGNITITRDLSLQGQGAIADRGAALYSSGVNTLSGVVDMGVAFNATNLNTRIVAADGTLNITGQLNVLGTAGTTINSLGAVNQAGASFYNVTGVLSGTGTLEGSGGGTLFLNPSDSSGFSGTIRVSGSAASGQSVVRIDSPGVLGTRTNGTTGAVLDMNGGVLAVLMDAPDVRVANGTNANVYFRASSTIFADHTPNSSVSDQTVAFGNMSFEDNTTLTFNGRNGYGMSFTTAPVNGGDNNNTITNNLQGGGLLSFVGNFWSNANNTGNRTMTFGGNGNTLINGNIIAESAAFNHNLTKSGSGTLTVTGTASTLDGTVSVSGGTLAISDWRAITNNDSVINIGSGSTGATLAVIGNNVAQANLTTSKVINLSGSTGGATILANQTGTSPGLILNADFTATGGSASQAKTLTLGGTNLAQNTINGVIPNNAAGGTVNLAKIDGGTWVLAGSNEYTGTTTISNGILRLKANDVLSTILSDASTVVFNQINQFAGGTLEFVGQPSVNNFETIGALTVTAGSGTIKLTPGSGGTVSLIFDALGAFGGGGTVNIVTPDAANTVSFTTIATENNIVNAGMYYNGANFAFTPGSGLAVRAPIYGDGLGSDGSDADFVTSATALTAAQSNEITGSFSNAAMTIDSLRIAGAHALTMTGLLTIRTDGVANASGGIIQVGGSASIGGTGVTTGGSGALVINVDGAADTLTLNAPISGGTGGFTKVGAGTLVIAATNTQTGTNSINEGIVRLTTGGRLSAGGSSSVLSIRQGAVLDLNGVSITLGIDDFNNNGTVTNSNAAPVTLTVGNSNGGGTSFGIVEDGIGGAVSVTKLGSGTQIWNGLSTYTGVTTIASTGIVTVNNVANGGFASGIGASTGDASNLVFTGTSATQAYGALNYAGTTNDFTDRLFTFNGGANGGARIQANGVNGATLTFTNTGALQFGATAAGNAQGLVLGGASTGDNRFFPIINDNGAAITSVYKADAGIWHLEAINGYTGNTELRGGTLYAQSGIGLPTASNLVFNRGILASTGTLNRMIGSGPNEMRFATPAADTAAFRGGFAGGGSKLTVDWGNGAVWGATADFINDRDGLIFGAMHGTTAVAKADVELISDFSLGSALGAAATPVVTTSSNTTVTFTEGTTAGLVVGQSISGSAFAPGTYIVSINSATQITISANATASATGVAATITGNSLRPIRVDDNTSIGADFATLSGVISGDAGTGIRKLGSGILVLSGANTYSGETNVNQGTLVVSSLGHSAIGGATSVGTAVGANLDSQAVTLGNGGTGSAILEYVGAGETSDRKIRLFSTTGSTQIHADGVGPLILTNVANDMVGGNKTLFLRGVNTGGNMITSVLADNGGTLGITIDSSATWILTNANTYTGNTSATGGALGLGHDQAIGPSGTLTILNSSIFAYGGDRTISNPVVESNSSSGVASFIGEYSLTFNGPWTNPTTSASGRFLRNNIVSGKTLTINGDYTFTAVTSGTNVTFDGSGDTIINGVISNALADTTTIGITYAGTGSLTLGGANIYDGNTQILNGTLRLGNDEVIPHGLGNNGSANGSLIINPALGSTAVLDLNGRTETINGLTANGLGTSIIDNTSATAASLIFGGTDAAVTFGGGTGSYTITDTGAGALSITKIGAAAAIIPTGVTLTYQGATNVSGGSLTIASPVDGTSALNVTNSGSTLALTGGMVTPSAVTGVVVENESLLSLLDGAGNKLNGLTSLQLGSSGGTLTTLDLNVGDLSLAGDEANTDTLTLLSGGTLTLFAGNQIQFNLTDIGLSANQTYELLNFIDGGFTTGALTAGDYLLGATPGGFTSITLTATDTSVFITTGNLITGALYWRGLTDNTWNGAVTNWSQDKAGLTPALTTPGQGTDVIFQWDAPTNDAVITTLEQNFSINSLTFEASTTPANTPLSVTIDPGTVATNRISVAPQDPDDGIKITAGGPATVTISGPVRLGADQTWGVADEGSVLSLGSLLGEADVTKTGAGKVILSAASDPTFNSGVTADIVINEGTLEIRDTAALGNTINSNLATITVNATGAFYYNGAASTLANPITLAGGTLSAGTANQTYSSPLNIAADSFINLRDSNATATNATARSITLSGILSGSGRITLRSQDTVNAGNQEAGTVTINNNANTGWSGGVWLESGTIVTTVENALGTGDIVYDPFGRIIVRGTNGLTYNFSNNVTFGGGAVGELSVDNTSSTLGDTFTLNLNGLVTIGGPAGKGTARLELADVASALNLTGGVLLANDASVSVGNGNSVVTISSVISETGGPRSLTVNDDFGGWGQTNRTLRLTALNTFSGNLILGGGIVEFDTVSDIGGPASSLGQGSAIDYVGSTTLRFIGDTSQSTNRPITSTAGVITLSANGTGGASITYAGAITVGPTADGSQLVLTGTAGSEGIISGGVAQTGDTADLTVNGGTWTHMTGTSRIGDDVTVTGDSTILILNSGLLQVRDDFLVLSGATLNLNATGVLTFNTPTLSTSGTLRAYTGGVINLGANNAVEPTEVDELRIGVDGAGLGTFNMNSFNQTVTAFILGNRDLGRDGLVTGTGTLTVTGNLDLYSGTVNANLASTGSTAFEKIGRGDVTLTGDNSGLASTGSTIVYEGSLILDYTLNNNTKLRSASTLDMRGGTLRIVGNDGEATVQTVGALTLGSGHSAKIRVSGGSGQEAVLNLNAITRANLSQDGTIRFTLPGGTQSAANGITTTTPNSNFGLLGTGTSAANVAGYATVDDGTGVWFATNNGGNIVALVSTPKNDVTTWLLGDHITDETTGFTGTIASASINSLRFDAAVGSDVDVVEGGLLNIASGGILITSNVAGTPGIRGGTLASSVQELVVTHDGAQAFEIGSNIRITHAVTKTGAGTLRLTGDNIYTGYTELQEGVLQISGGNAIGDYSLVTLSAYRDTRLELLDDEVIGRLQGGQRGTDDDHGTVAIGEHTLTINQSSSTTYAGFFTGTGNIVKQGSGNLQLTNVSSGFIGLVTVESGTLYLTTAGSLSASIVRVNKGGALVFDQNGSTAPGSHLDDAVGITLNSADGGFLGSPIVRGLGIRTDTSATRDELVGTVTLNSGANYVGMEATAAGADADIVAANIVRLNNSTLDVRGYNLGISNTRSNQFRIGDAANEAAFMAAAANLVGGGGATASKNISIVPWAIGENHLTTNLGSNNMGNSLVTYEPGLGFRALDITPGTGEYNTFGTLASATDNVRETLSANLAGLASTTVNALVINNEATSTVNVTGNGAGQTLAITSGAMLFTVTGAAANIAYNTELGGFDAGITVSATGEYVFHVVNPNSSNSVTGGVATFGSTRVTVASTADLLPGMAIYGTGIPVGATVASITSATVFEMTLPGLVSTSTTSTQTYTYSTLESLTAVINSPLTSFADITKSGRGVLTLSGINTAGGGLNKTTLNEGILQIGDLDNIGGSTGALVFAGGTLRLASSFMDDISQRTITLLEGGGTLDTNGVDLTVSGSIGSGPGGFTKTGAGILTLNAAAGYSGPTTILGGTLAVGVDNATNGTALNLGAGTTLDIADKNITTRKLTTFGVSPTIFGTGTITSSEGFHFGNAGNLDVGAVLAGPGGLFKNLSDVLTLTGFNTFTGPVELQGGTLAFTTIGNIGEGASSLGAPTTLEDGIIHTGLGSTSVSLTYLGGGSTTNRPISMQSTTGNLTINANGTGALVLGKVQTETNGDKDLILRGTSAPVVENTVSLIEQYVTFLNVIKADANTWVLTGANNYTGATTAGGGILRAANDLAFGPVGVVTLANTDAVLELAEGITIGNALTVSTAGSNKTLQLQNGATAATYAGPINILETTGGFFDISVFASGTFTISGAIEGITATGVTKVNAGTAVLSGANTYTGATTISQGKLQLGDGATTGTLATASAISIASGATFAVNRSDLVTQGVDFTGNALTGAGSFEQAGSGTTVLNAANAYTGGTVINGGILRVDSANAIGTTGEISFGGGTLQYSASNQFDYSARFSTAVGQEYRIDTNGQTVTYATSLTSDGGTLTKLGTGRLTLSAATANTFTGATTVAEGVLTVDGSLAGSVNVTGGTFNGGISGTPAVISGPVTVDGGEFSAGSRTTQTAVEGNNGNGIGQMNVGMDMTWNGGSTLVFDFSSTTGIGTEGTNWDFLNITGALEINANSSNKITLFIDSWSDLDNYGAVSSFDPNSPESAFPTPSYTWLWAQTGGITDGTNALSGDLTDYFAVDATRANTGALNFHPNTTGGSFWVSAVGSSLYINYAAVPEPSSMVLVGIAGLGLAAYRRRKRRREDDTAAAAAELG